MIVQVVCDEHSYNKVMRDGDMLKYYIKFSIRVPSAHNSKLTGMNGFNTKVA